MTQTISATLPSGTLYVSGTVNGVDKTWTNTTGSVWETTADRAADDTYYVELTLISSTGTTTTQSLTLYYGVLHLITDRTKADTDRAAYLNAKGWDNMTEAEKNEWQSGLKGAYNASDLNRVGAAMVYIMGRFNGVGYSVAVNPRQNWVAEDIPTQAEMTAYLLDVSVLRSILAKATTPAVPDDMERLTWTEANNIEKILLDIDELLTNMAAAWYHSGEIYSGEV